MAVDGGSVMCSKVSELCLRGGRRRLDMTALLPHEPNRASDQDGREARLMPGVISAACIMCFQWGDLQRSC
ncbi:hypothetical protein WJX84_000042 [Apatococcus fuscideae]|uniref:Uncharacterized protein n=1 Tax=Apatococcus fuscideae TaxID=2026836 RepID=A0AAW1T5X3_9CHLO